MTYEEVIQMKREKWLAAQNKRLSIERERNEAKMMTGDPCYNTIYIDGLQDALKVAKDVEEAAALLLRRAIKSATLHKHGVIGL